MVFIHRFGPLFRLFVDLPKVIAKLKAELSTLGGLFVLATAQANRFFHLTLRLFEVATGKRFVASAGELLDLRGRDFEPNGLSRDDRDGALAAQEVDGVRACFEDQWLVGN